MAETRLGKSPVEQAKGGMKGGDGSISILSRPIPTRSIEQGKVPIIWIPSGYVASALEGDDSFPLPYLSLTVDGERTDGRYAPLRHDVVCVIGRNPRAIDKPPTQILLKTQRKDFKGDLEKFPSEVHFSIALWQSGQNTSAFAYYGHALASDSDYGTILPKPSDTLTGVKYPNSKRFDIGKPEWDKTLDASGQNSELTPETQLYLGRWVDRKPVVTARHGTFTYAFVYGEIPEAAHLAAVCRPISLRFSKTDNVSITRFRKGGRQQIGFEDSALKVSPSDLIDVKGKYRTVFGSSEQEVSNYASGFADSGELVDAVVINDKRLKPVHAFDEHENFFGRIFLCPIKGSKIYMKGEERELQRPRTLKEGDLFALGYADDRNTLTRVVMKRA